MKSAPCREYPDDATFKTIAVICDTCDRMDCWLGYLRWERDVGVTLNKREHPCAACDRDNCRVAFWEERVRRIESGLDPEDPMAPYIRADDTLPLEDAVRARDAARVSCFIRAGQRARYPR